MAFGFGVIKGKRMNIEGKKRIVITCPHCHKDYAFNGDYLYQRKRKLAEETSVIIAQLTAYREEHSLSKKELQKDAYYKKLMRQPQRTLKMNILLSAC